VTMHKYDVVKHQVRFSFPSLFLSLPHTVSLPQSSGGIFELGAGWVSRLRWQRSRGGFFQLASFSPEAVRDKFEEISDFDGHPVRGGGKRAGGLEGGRPETDKGPCRCRARKQFWRQWQGVGRRALWTIGLI
jgi:hypothetical protein